MIPFSSNTAHKNFVWVNFGPKDPFLKSFLEESAGFQNWTDLEVTAQNLKSSTFLDHWSSVIASEPAET